MTLPGQQAMVQLLRWSAAGLGSLALAVSLPQSRVADALDRYDGGEHDAGIASLNLDTLTVGALRTESERWIAVADTAGRARRRLTAAAFAVDVLWAATRHAENRFNTNVDPIGATFDRDRARLSRVRAGFVVVDWAARLVPRDGPVIDAERWWRLAALGVLQDGHAWTTLLESEHLGRARARLPDEPRLRMVEAVARAARELGTLREWNGGRADVLRDERLGSHVTRRVPDAVRLFEALRDDPSLAGEAELRIGYLELRRRRWNDALDRFRGAESVLADSFLQAVAGYMSGWVLEEQQRHQEAIDAYRRARALAPDMRSVATRLAALLFVAHERSEAHQILRTAHESPPPFELLTMFERGDARFVPEYLRRVRQALQ